jgi:hypothetical protein
MIFPPFQHPETELGGRKLLVTAVAAQLGAGGRGAPGVVLARTPQGIEVAVGEGSLTLPGLADPARPEAPCEVIRASVQVGDRLGGSGPSRGAA